MAAQSLNGHVNGRRQEAGPHVSSDPRPTLLDVAGRAGVSLKTASRALNGETYVADGTRTRVLVAAREMGYQLNRTASLLARRIDASVVGLITADLANPFYSALAKGMEHELRAHGTQLIVASSDEQPDRERELLAELVVRQVRAVVLVSTIDDHRALASVQARGIPIVFADRVGVGIDADSVILDNRLGSRIAVQHLVAGGHTSIGFVGDLSRLQTDRERFDGFISAMQDAGLDPARSVRHEAHDSAAARDATRELLTQPDPPTALFTSNNRITIGALHALKELQARTALVGFDDFELADLLGITVIAHDPVEMGRTAAGLALRAVKDRPTRPSRIVMPTQLIPRGSGER